MNIFSIYYSSSNDPVMLIFGILFIILFVALACKGLNDNDSGEIRRNYSNNNYDFDDVENYNWDDSWDDKWLHQGEYADDKDVPEYNDYDPSWDEHFRD